MKGKISRGVGRVQEMLHENGNGDAVFDLDKITVFNVIIKENPEDAALAAAQTRGEKSSEKTTQKRTRKEPENSQKILAAIRKNPLAGRRELAKLLGLSDSLVRSQMERLKKLGSLRRVGPDKGGHWEVIGKE